MKRGLTSLLHLMDQLSLSKCKGGHLSCRLLFVFYWRKRFSLCRDAVEFLSSEGHIYSTIDDEHYKATDSM